MVYYHTLTPQKTMLGGIYFYQNNKRNKGPPPKKKSNQKSLVKGVLIFRYILVFGEDLIFPKY